mmetsp:Transcript_998/g.3584  ORF Transcript_998/g.3584 Transcript_998/m.3584 type:complete len:251 (+) Transcript_998:186-938(+)
MASPVVSVGFMNAILFHSYSKGKCFFDSQLSRLEQSGVLKPMPGEATSHEGRGWEGSVPEETDRALSVFLGGCTGGLACAVVTCPSELVKIQMQVLRRQGVAQPFTGSWSCARYLVRRDGFMALSRGMCVTLMRDVHSYGAYFLSYEMTKVWLGHKFSMSKDAAATQLTAGAVAGVVAWSCCYPVDVIKSRIQSDMKGERYSTVWKTARDSYRRDGARVFFRGYLASIARAVPVNATTFLTYEWILTLFP